jgi:NRPS condensation-like uncharacterized protein
VRAPIPFDPADKFFLLFEGQGPPVSCIWALRLSGEVLDEARLLRAAEQTCVRHPKAASRLQITPGKLFGERLAWVPAQDAPRPTWLVHAAQPAPNDGSPPSDVLTELLNLPLDAEVGPLAQIHWIPHARDEGTLVFRFHHALCDGMGSLPFLQDLFALYNQNPPRTPPPDYWAPPAPQVADRGLARLRLFGRLVALHSARARRYNSAPQAKLFDLNRRLDGRVCALGRTIAPDKLRNYVAWSRAVGCSVNDLLVAAHGLAIERWMTERGLSCGMLRCAVTQNLRRGSEQLAILNNHSSGIPVWMGPQDRARASELIRWVQQQMRECVERRIGEANVVANGALRLPLRWARTLAMAVARQPKVTDSLVISNVGRLLDPTPGSGWLYLGSGRIVSAHAFVRPAEGIGAVSAATTVGDRLALSWSYLGGLFEETEVQRVLALLEEALDEITR